MSLVPLMVENQDLEKDKKVDFNSLFVKLTANLFLLLFISHADLPICLLFPKILLTPKIIKASNHRAKHMPGERTKEDSWELEVKITNTNQLQYQAVKKYSKKYLADTIFHQAYHKQTKYISGVISNTTQPQAF